MARAGARGETAAEIDDVLHMSNLDELLGGLIALDQALGARDATWQDSEAKGQAALRIANASFGQNGWTIEQAFLDALASTFGSGFTSSTTSPIRKPPAMPSMAGSTSARLGESPSRSATRRDRGDASLSGERHVPQGRVGGLVRGGPDGKGFVHAPRWLQGGRRHDDPILRRNDPVIPYARGSGWQAVDLRYKSPPGSPPLAMTLVLPKNLPAFESKLDGALLSRIVTKLDAERTAFAEPECPPEFDAGCYPYDLRLHLPRFSIDSRAELGELLAAAGMPRAFGATADFTGIHAPESGEAPLFISAVIHQANIDVDEHGTEAAAATAVGMDTGGGPSALDNITIRFDRPFLFLVRDVETGTILFMGRVVDPSDTPLTTARAGYAPGEWTPSLGSPSRGSIAPRESEPIRGTTKTFGRARRSLSSSPS